MNRTLRGKLLMRISIVAFVSFLLSALFTGLYFKVILEEQIINNDKIKLRQTARQLQYMTENAANFTSFLIISDKLQSFFKTYESLDTYGKFAITQDTIDFVQRNRGLNKEITNFIFVLPSGKAIWSEAQSDDYIVKRLKEPWYQNYADSGQNSAFTETHLLYRSGSSTTESVMLSYITKVKDMNSGAPIGELIINLDYADFESLLSFGSESFDGYLWLNGDGQLLFGKKRTPARLAELVLTHAGDAAEAADGALDVSGGYALVDRFSENNWRLVSFTSMWTLLSRSQFAIYLLIVFTLTSTILALVLMMPVILNITRPIYRLYHAMNLVSGGNLHTSVSIRSGDELEKLGHGFNRMIEQLRVHLEESVRYEQEKRDMEVELLLSQINPHFIYNTLNTIIFMAQKHKNDDIVRMTGAFITLLQDTVRLGEAQSLISLEEEMRIIGEYAVIQSYRYRDMFELSWDMQEEALDCLMPRNILQPLVENAIFHGIRPSSGKGLIRISVALTDGRLTIRIKDNGVGIPKERLETLLQRGSSPAAGGHGLHNIGLANTVKRLERMYKGDAELRVESESGKGTAISIVLPQIRRNADAVCGAS